MTSCTIGHKLLVLNKAKSDILPVTSGVLQDSVLNPVLFLVYINMLPSHVDCFVGLFTDTSMYQMVDITTDEERFQINLEPLNTWA